MDEDGFDEEIQELIKSFLKSGINFFRVSNRQNKHFMRMFDMDDGPGTFNPSGSGFGTFTKDDMKRWRKDNR